MATATRVFLRIGTGKCLRSVCPATAQRSCSSARSAPRQPAARGARSPPWPHLRWPLLGACVPERPAAKLAARWPFFARSSERAMLLPELRFPLANTCLSSRLPTMSTAGGSLRSSLSRDLLLHRPRTAWRRDDQQLP